MTLIEKFKKILVTKFKNTKFFIWSGIGLGVCYWTFETIIHVAVFKNGTFWGELFSDDPMELWMRVTVLAILFGFGVFAQFAYNKLQKASNEIKTLRGLLSICAYCKNIRDDDGTWKKIEAYIHKHSYANFTHGICPGCMRKHFPNC